MALVLSFDWENGEGIHGEAYARTYASLSIKSSEGQYITRILDGTSKSIRNELRVPLFLLARWIVENWWYIFYEPSSTLKRSTRTSDVQFRSRHSLKWAGEGYALPDVLFEPTGDWVQVSWRGYAHEFAKIEFQESGKIVVPKAELEKEIRQFVGRILARMEERDCADINLSRDWQSVLSVDHEQLDFCAAVAATGKDPFSLSTTVRHSLMVEWGRAKTAGLTDQMFREICVVSSPATLGSTISLVSEQLNYLSDSNLSTVVLKAGKKLKRPSPANGTFQNPWNWGYVWANRVRSDLLNEASHSDIGKFLVDKVDVLPDLSDDRAFKAIVGPTKRDKVGIGIREGRDDSQRFRASRALFLALASMDQNASASVVTVGETDMQQASRAFGAELLAPALAIKRLLRNRWLVGSDDIEELASVFHVSPILIQHQLANHQIAEIEV